jgi:hypothetical protein
MARREKSREPSSKSCVNDWNKTRRRDTESADAIRADPLANWRFIPACVRPYFVKRVCLFGPESTGKSTLARDLAAHFETVHLAEFARGLLEPKCGVCDPTDIPLIARGQIAAEDALARRANKLLFCDTDVLTTTIWSDVLFGECPASIRELAARRHYDRMPAKNCFEARPPGADRSKISAKSSGARNLLCVRVFNMLGGRCGSRLAGVVARLAKISRRDRRVHEQTRRRR